LSGTEEDRRNWLRRPKLCIKSCTAIIIIIIIIIIIMTGLAVTKAICCFMYTTNRLGLKMSLFQQFLIKV